MKYPIFFLLLYVFACNGPAPVEPVTESESVTPVTPVDKPEFANRGHELVYEATEAMGDYGDLAAKNDVVYTYTYRTPDGQEDISIEKYLFDGEYSIGDFRKRSRTSPELEGRLVQGYDGETFWVALDGERVTDEAAIDRSTFTRKTNFYWFAMNQKMLDPGMNYEYLREQEVDGKTYDVVAVTYDDSVGVAQDTYHLFINRDTKLIDQFLFTVMAVGREEPLLMRNTYEDFDGVQIATYRKYTPSNWNGDVLEEKWTEEISEDVRFNTGLTEADFQAPGS